MATNGNEVCHCRLVYHLSKAVILSTVIFCFFFLFFVIFFTRLRLRINEHIINLLQQRNTGQWLFIYSPMASRENMEAAWREHAL